MKWKNLIKVALKSIMKNRMRSLLTVLGIIIGVGAVIALVSIGQGASASIEKQIAGLGSNLIMIFPGHTRVGGVSMGAQSRRTITMEDFKSLEKEARMLKAISPMVRSGGQVIAGDKNWATSVNGVAPNYLEIREWGMTKGEFFGARDVLARRKVAVLGKTVAAELFGEIDPVGQRIRIGNIPFQVMGVLKERGESMGGQDQDDVILAPFTTVLYRMSDGQSINAIMASAISVEKMDAAYDEITNILRTAHKLLPGDDDDFNVRSQTDIIETATNVTGIMTMVLGAIAGVSLLVGGIGIMNIMLVSVTERTREIGIRLAIGARGGDILVQFLIEAVTLSLFGGIIGILSGIGLGKMIANLINMSIIVNPVVVFGAFFFSGAVGIFFGFYPAMKASKLNPIDALRYE
ncbi:MAG: ABC transporter permease [Acidobacteria bacterium]|nr:ABC transporter permease [Acidobacteriota bacterium]